MLKIRQRIRRTLSLLAEDITRHRLLWFFLAFFSFFYSIWVLTRHNFFGTDAVDLGIFDQIIWKYSQFKEPLSTVKFSTYPGVNILGDHFHPIIAILSPLLWFWNNVAAILIAQVLLVVGSAWPIYKIALVKFNSKMLALGMSVSYLSFIGLQTLLEYDFHEVAFALPLLSFSFYFLELKKHFYFYVCLALSFLVKEDMPLVMATLGIWAFLRLREYKLGLITFGVSGVFYFLVTRFIIPYFKGAHFDYEHLDPSVGKSTSDLLLTAVTDPLLVIRTAFYDGDWIKLRTMLNLASSYLFLPLISPTSLIMLIPNIVSRFLTELPKRWIIRFQYSAIWDPILAIGTIYAIKNLLSFSNKFHLGQKLSRKALPLLGLALIASSLYVTWKINGPLTHRIFNPSFYRPLDRYAQNYALLALIPPEASVMAQSAFVPHLSHRDQIYRYDDTIFAKKIFPDYIIMSTEEHSDPPYTQEDLTKRVLQLKENTLYHVLSWDGARLLLRKNNENN